jgi:hypothetical protein
MHARRRRTMDDDKRLADERRESPQEALLDLQRSAGNQATGRLVQRYVTDRRGKRMDPDEVRTALIKRFNVPPTDQESMAVIDAVIKDHKPHTFDEAVAMMPEPRYVPSGRRESAKQKGDDFGHQPLGFKSRSDFQLFVNGIYANLPAMVKDATIVMHGSSLSGQSFKDKGGGSRFFDVGRDSDYDVAIASETLWKLAADVGIKIRGDHSEPLTAEGIAALGLKKAYDSANFLARREVNFMLYENEKTAHQHEGAALVAPEAEDYREGMGLLHGDI